MAQVILDTVAYNALLGGNKAVVEIINTAHELVVPFIVVGELKYGYLKGSRREYNQQTLEQFLSQPYVRMELARETTADHYAELYVYAEQRGRALSHNDLWIAALAKETGLPLVTLDQDFAVFEEVLGKQLHLLPTSTK